MASPCFAVPLPGGRPMPSGRISMSHPAISAGLASRPMPRCLNVSEGVCSWLAFGAAATAPAPIATMLAPNSAPLTHLDIFDLAVLLDMPGLDAVVVVDRIDAAVFAKLRLARLHVAALVHGARLDEQLAAVPVELVIEARQRLVPCRAVDFRRTPVAAAVERDIDARDPAAPRPGDAREHGEARLVVDRRLRTRIGDDGLRLHQIGEA